MRHFAVGQRPFPKRGCVRLSKGFDDMRVSKFVSFLCFCGVYKLFLVFLDNTDRGSIDLLPCIADFIEFLLKVWIFVFFGKVSLFRISCQDRSERHFHILASSVSLSKELSFMCEVI